MPSSRMKAIGWLHRSITNTHFLQDVAIGTLVWHM